MIISISGMFGAGKSTVAKPLAKKLGLEHFYMGGIIRKMAQEKDLTLHDFYDQNLEIDKIIDNHLSSLGKEKDNFLVESRTAFHFIPHSIKIYLDVNLDEGAKRIFKESKKKNERNEREYKSVEEVKDWIKKRLKEENEHYGKLYNFNAHDKSHFDYVLDTTNLTFDQVQEKILNFIQQFDK